MNYFFELQLELISAGVVALSVWGELLPGLYWMFEAQIGYSESSWLVQ